MRAMSLLVVLKKKKQKQRNREKRENGNRKEGWEKGRKEGERKEMFFLVVNFISLKIPPSFLELVALFIILYVEGVGINCIKICNALLIYNFPKVKVSLSCKHKLSICQCFYLNH